MMPGVTSFFVTAFDFVVLASLWADYYLKRMHEESLESAKAAFTVMGMAEIADVMAKGYEENGYRGAMTSAAETMAEFSKQTYISPYFIAETYVFAEGHGMA
ncbi:MAG: hypothetical protein R6V04_08595 [bacterium]